MAVDRGGGGKGKGVLGGREGSESRYFKWRDDWWMTGKERAG